MNRRDFIEKSFFASLSTLVLGACTSSEKKEAPKQATEPPQESIQQEATPVGTPEATATESPTPAPAKKESVKYVDPQNKMAVNLKYVEDAKNADPALRIKRGDVEGKDQLCSNCSFYTPEAGKTYGKCTLLPDGYVPAKGWCSTWAKKV
ncbi:MAG TPA: high-potential iron-sulfur protein [Oligoflexia bacterium]|nr:high-potential iron-sulfur protein [Oligoflexia bacterium]HMR24759.1 high-potential iron-sulfur protein [Oligoflexia bacterium]